MVKNLRFSGPSRVGIAVRTYLSSLGAMLTNFVMTIIGADRPGLVELFASRLADHGGNWLESRMENLGGQFAGIVRAEVESDKADELLKAMHALEVEGLRVIVHTELEVAPADSSLAATLNVVGQDRPGILRAVSAVFTTHTVNVEELSSERVSAPMGGGTLFQATIKVSAASADALAEVQSDLEKIATDLMVDLKLNSEE